MKPRSIDHLVYFVPDLEKSMQELGKSMGAKIYYGGQHPNHGTHNALVNLGNGIYLELLAIDKKNTSISTPRWMGIDENQQSLLTRWAIKSNDLKADASILQRANSEMGKIIDGSRKKSDGSMLQWEMILPLAKPAIEVLPFVINWKESIHPSQSLPDICKLVKLKATHPHPEMIAPTLTALKVDIELVEGKEAALRAEIETPKGLFVL